MHRIIAGVAIILSGCGALAPDPPAPKSGTDGGTTPAQTDGGTGTSGVDEAEWGTRGPASLAGKSPGGHAKCDMQDVRTDDLGTQNSTMVPDGAWPDVVPDDVAKCGDDLETLAWRLMNCERFASELQPITCDLRMVWLGRAHSVDMEARGYFSHDSPDGDSPFDRMEARQIGFTAAAENIAGAPEVLDGHWSWMDSAGHRANILGNFTYGGVGIAPSRVGLYETAPFFAP